LPRPARVVRAEKTIVLLQKLVIRSLGAPAGLWSQGFGRSDDVAAAASVE
jgi:hypothetical protein